MQEAEALRCGLRDFSQQRPVFCNRDSGPERGWYNECGQVCPSFEEKEQRSRDRGPPGRGTAEPSEEKNEISLRLGEQKELNPSLGISSGLAALRTRGLATRLNFFFLLNRRAIVINFHFVKVKFRAR